MEYHIVPVTSFQQNCSLLVCPQSRRAAIVDPGGEAPRLLKELERLQVMPERILITHAHLDHAGATAELVDLLHLPVEGPQRGDQFWIDAIPQQAQMFGMAGARKFRPDRWLNHGDTVQFGGVTLEVLHCPGHTPGHIVFFNRADRLAVVGDVLFQGSIGRTDFPGGDQNTLLSSIRDHLLPLGDDVTFIPGHGPVSTIGAERRTNPFVTGL